MPYSARRILPSKSLIVPEILQEQFIQAYCAVTKQQYSRVQGYIPQAFKPKREGTSRSERGARAERLEKPVEEAE